MTAPDPHRAEADAHLKAWMVVPDDERTERLLYLLALGLRTEAMLDETAGWFSHDLYPGRHEGREVVGRIRRMVAP